MVGLEFKLRHLFPGKKGNVDWFISQDKDGNLRIDTWNLPGNPPSEAALNAVPDSVATSLMKQEVFDSQLTKIQRAFIQWQADILGVSYDAAKTQLRDIWDNL